MNVIFRTSITLLGCLLFFIWGAVGDALLNIIPCAKTDDKFHLYLPPLTQLLENSFPLNQYYFFFYVSPVFCAAQLIILLLTSSKKPLVASHYFSEGSLLILIFFGLYFGCFVLAVLMPFHLLVATEVGPMTTLNIITSIFDYALWLGVFALLARLIVNWLKEIRITKNKR